MRRMRRLALALAVLALVAGLWWLATDDAPPAPRAAGDGTETANATDAASGGDPAVAEASTPTDARRTTDDRTVTTTARDPFAAQRTGYTGRVVAAIGTPVPGMRVRLFRAAPQLALPAGFDAFSQDPPDLQLEAAHTTSGEDGRFRLDGVLPRGIAFLRLEWPDVERAPLPWRAGDRTVVPVQRTPAPGEVIDLGDVVLEQGALLTGRAVDERGDPIAGVLVRSMRLPPIPLELFPLERLSPDDGIVVTFGGTEAIVELPPWSPRIEDALPLLQTHTGEDGRFSLYGVDAGSNLVAFTKSALLGTKKAGVDVRPGQQLDLGDVTLQDGEESIVRVRTADGEAVAGAEVFVAAESMTIPVHLAERYGSTDAKGEVLAQGLPRSRARAAARRSAKEPWILGPLAPAGSDLEVVLPAQHDLVLRVKRPDGTPCKETRLQFARGDRDRMSVEFAMFGAGAHLDLRSRTSTDEDGNAIVRDVPAGPWTLLVTAKDCAVESLQLTVTGDAAIDVQLRRATPGLVRVLDERGEPVPLASIYVQPRDGTRAQRILELPVRAGETDERGECRLRDLPTARTKVTAEHPAHGQVHVEVQGTPEVVELRFEGACSIRGTLTDGGRAPAPGRWVAVLERRYPEGRPRGAMPDLPQLQMPGLDGSFAFAALQPGAWRVTVQDAMTDVGTVAGMFEYASRRKSIFPWNKAELDLRAGETAEVRLDAMVDAKPYEGPGANVRGTVTIDGLPGEGALVVGTSQPGDRRVTSRVDRGGAFDLGRCPEGALRVVVVPKDVAESRLMENLFSHHFAEDRTVIAEQPMELTIAVETSAVFGEVRGPNGRPVADARVVLHKVQDGGASSALRVVRTDAHGRFRAEQLPLGRFDVRVEHSGTGRASTKVVLTSPTELGPLVVDLVATTTVRGKLDPAALEGGRGVVLLRPTNGGAELRADVRGDGSFQFRDVDRGSYTAVLRTGSREETIGACEGNGEPELVLRTSRDPR